MIGAALATVFEALDYRDSEGLVTVETGALREDRAYIWHETVEKFEMDAAYFHGNVPIVYFKEFSNFDDSDAINLHRSLWNHNRVPLLIAVLPSEVRVYNCFAPPQRRPDRFNQESPILLKRVVHLLLDELTLRRELADYRRREIESGQFAQIDKALFGREQRVDHRLLENLAELRHLLISEGLSDTTANNLLGRAIFVRYLEDREVIGREFYEQFSGGRSFRELLKASLPATYQVFGELARRLNGDVFPVDSVERREVRPDHLRSLGRFLDGEELSSGQTYFWAYDFKYIPIELISAIYETFLGAKQREAAAYYTPPEMVDFVLNEMMPFETGSEDIRILDPACGSGIFLVQAYRRLVMRYRRRTGVQRPSYSELRDLLTGSIHGVDLSQEAIQVAAFSCYLALLDFLEPKSIWETVQFPTLKDRNLFISDFFDEHAPFNDKRYDLIIGNPPWQSALSGHAADYVNRSGYPVGDKQVAQAFMWRAPTLLTERGKVCLLAPSKGVLFNQSGPNQDFRREFFSIYRVTKLVDFSTLRHSIFQRSIAPMVAVFYQARAPNGSQDVTYFSPRSSPLAERLAGVIIYGDEVRRISQRQAIQQSNIWKIALWGTPRDLLLINDLRQRFPTLAEVAHRRGWLIRKGATVNGNSSHYAPEMATLRYVPVRALDRLRVTSDPNKRIGRQHFHRPGDRRVYKGPHTLIRGGLAHGFIAAAFLPYDAVFADGIIGIAGPNDDTDYLKVICAYANSSLARYYQFLTSSTWGVERDVIRLIEHSSFPSAVPLLDGSLLRDLVTLVDSIDDKEVTSDWQSALDELVFRAYGLTPAERDLIEDTIAVTVDSYYHGAASRAFAAPSTEDLTGYAGAYAEVFQAATRESRSLHPTVYEGNDPYRAVSFQVAPDGSGHHQPDFDLVADPELDRLLSRLERLLAEQHSQSLYFQRNVKVFEREAIHVLKPAEHRFWTKSAAYNDADETIAQLLRASASDKPRTADTLRTSHT